MSQSNISIVPRVNFFDGQKLTESDLDQEQMHQRGLTSDHVMLAHGSGIVKENPLEDRVLFSLKNPGLYGDNDSKFLINAGNFDGKPIFLDRQPSNQELGKRLIFELSGANIKNNYPLKITILGTIYNPLKNIGDITVEYIEFFNSSKKITSNYYKNIYAIYFNNLSGGIGKSFYENSVSSFDYLSSQDINITVSESGSIQIFSNSICEEKIESPNYYLNNFITYSNDVSLLDIFEEALDSSFSSSEIYYENSPSEILLFPEGGSSSVSYGQKFLAKTAGLQKLSILLGIDTSVSDNFSGNLVISLHKLTTATNCTTDAVPDNLIEFDPETTSLVEVSYSYDDLLSMGVKLNNNPTKIDFDLSSTLLANPNLEPSLEKDSYYCFLIKRVGNTSIGTIKLYQGYNKAYRKKELGLALTIQEEYEIKDTLFTEFDIVNNKYVDNYDRNLWFELHSSSIEVTSGKAISEDGIQFEIPSHIQYIGNNLIPFFVKNIELKNINGEKNYIVLDRSEKFTSPIAHPRTGNYTFTRILDSYSISVLLDEELNLVLDLNPNILGYVLDVNDRSPSDLSGEFTFIGQITPDKIYFINPANSLKSKSLLNRIFIPDTNCSCNSQYRISSITCSIQMLGDLNSDGVIDYNDLSSIVNLAGNAITSNVTKTNILNGSIDLIDFYKSDLNSDGLIDGSDISILEDAIDGYVNFTGPEKFTVLEIGLSNIDKNNNNPLIFQDTSNSGTTTSSNTISFNLSSDNLTRVIRIGDKVLIPETEADSGEYVISEISYLLLAATVTVTTLEGEAVSFIGSSGFNISIYSGTEVNLLADNNSIVSMPIDLKKWTITSFGNSFSNDLLEVIDLRRFADQSILEVSADSCICEDDSCFNESPKAPLIKNQKVIPNDLYIPSGNILSAPGIPHHGDFEYVNVILPIPPGSINNCSINIYDTFIKSYNGTCNTIAGYPAMKYSDGTLVGCNDSGSKTDLSLGRVKISKAISSLHIDSAIDGYTIDGYQNEVSADFAANNIILNSSNLEVYSSGFYTWPLYESDSNTAINIFSNYSSFELNVDETSSTMYSTLNRPLALPDLEGDFTISFTGIRSSWDPSKLVLGNIQSYIQITVNNDYGGTSVLKLGWRQYGDGDGIEIFWSGSINDGSTEISSFDYKIDSPELEGEEVNFRIRRVNDITSAYYYHPNTSSLINNQEYIRIGSLPDINPGEGSADITFKVESSGAGTSTPYIYKTYFYSNDFSINFNENTSSEEASSEILIGNNSGKLNSLAFNFPLNLNSSTEIISAEVRFVASQNFSISSSDFKLIGYENINADNLSKYLDLKLSQNVLLQSALTPISGSAGDFITIDLTDSIKEMLAEEGHLSGYYKAFILTSSTGEAESFYISNEINISITYYDSTSGVVFKVGSTIDPATGVLTLSTKNVLYDTINLEDRTTINLGVYLKKSGFKNSDLQVSISDLKRIGIGTCIPE